MLDTNTRILEEQLCFSVYNASKQFTKLYREALEPFQLTYPQYIALLVLWEVEEQTVSELGKRLALDSGTLTPMLKRMEHLGYVTRSRHPEDERRVYIRLTEKAIKIQPDVLKKRGQLPSITRFCRIRLHTITYQNTIVNKTIRRNRK